MRRTVWTLAHADAIIYRENPDGTYQDTDINGPIPVLTYCFLSGVTCTAAATIQRRAVTGRGRRKIVSPSQFFDDIQISVNAMFFRKSEEFNTSQIFIPSQQLRIELRFEEEWYTGVAPYENDKFEYSFARATRFGLSGREADTVEATAEFEAELML